MQTIGHGNDSWMIFLTIAISMVVGTILFGGPAEAVRGGDMHWSVTSFGGRCKPSARGSHDTIRHSRP